ncbi:MAG TPA: TetR/AcrR family transcriptional regulator [Solirubrobacteraceae bacterium]|nr:TetR/AcrR family transcriptional regulator [Solirubrobacteraceae bacterium]
MPATASERRYGGKTATERRDERRERLLDAGLELFGTDGFAAVTIEALCAEAGLNPRYFYEQFATREELLGAVYERHVVAVLQTVQDAIAQSPADPTRRLRAGLSAFVTATLADERAARINYFEMVGVSAELEAQRRGVLRAYAELIAAQAADMDDLGPLGRGDRRMTAVALTGATDGLITDWMSSEPRPPRQAIVYTLLQIFAG